MCSVTKIYSGKGDYVMDRIPGYSDEMMYRQSELLHGIVFKTKLVKSGRGKNAVMIEQRCYEHYEIVERRAVDSL